MRPAPSAIAHASPRHCVCLSSSLLSVPRDKSAVIARRHAEAIQCGSLSKTGLPRFLTEPRNDSENANPSSLRMPTPPSLRGGTPKQSIAVHCRKLDCRGSLRNLAMTAKKPTPRHCGSLRNHAMTVKAENVKFCFPRPRFVFGRRKSLFLKMTQAVFPAGLFLAKLGLSLSGKFRL